MEWACPPGTLPDIHVPGSHQTLRQLGTVVHDCNPGYGGGGAEAGVQGMRGYRVRLCLKTKQPQLSFSRLATLPLTPQDSLRKQACSSHLASFTLFSLGFSPSVSNPRSKPFATEVAGSRAILSVCCHLSEPAAAQLL